MKRLGRNLIVVLLRFNCYSIATRLLLIIDSLQRGTYSVFHEFYYRNACRKAYYRKSLTTRKIIQTEIVSVRFYLEERRDRSRSLYSPVTRYFRSPRYNNSASVTVAPREPILKRHCRWAYRWITLTIPSNNATSTLLAFCSISMQFSWILLIRGKYFRSTTLTPPTLQYRCN